MPSQGQCLTDEIKLKIAFNEELSLTYFNNNSHSFEELRQEIRKICNFTLEQKFTIKWIDNEGDPCTISSQIEFEEAVRLYELTSDSQLNLHIFDNVPPPGKLCVGENKQIYRTATKSWRKVYKVNGHTLCVKRFNKKTYCICCSDRIWGLGRQGLKCIHCKVLVHKKCHKGLFIRCTKDSLLDIKKPLPRKIFFLGSSNALAVESKNQKHYSLEDFNLIKVIGRGSYAKVLMVELKETKRMYAMKVIRKDTLSGEEDMDWIQTEKHILELASNHPFLIGLHSCFQTELRLFFVVELAKGGDLMYHMQKKKKLPEFHVQFYAAEIILALNFLHNKGIIYRDLKLDNVLLDHDGHIKLTDYGMSKEGITNDELTSTFCGTPNYIAPEIILGKDYGFSVDWWALGVLMFEMLSGRSPFISDHPDDAYEDFLFQVILERPITIPRTLSVKAISILRGFLNKNPTERLGCVKPEGFLEIVNHPFFKTLDWAGLKEKKIRSPYVPPQDILNFPCEFTKEPIEFTPDDHRFVNDKIDQSEFEGFDYVNPFLMSAEDYV